MAELRLSRRRVLDAGAAVGVVFVTGLTAACTAPAPEAPEEPDPLETPATRAEADVALARAVAGAYPELGAAATAFAVDRQAHATALRDELRRVRPEPSLTSGSSAPSAIPVAPTADAAGARTALATAVQVAQDEAAGLVAGLPGYRAALLASVAACCASHAVLL